jgi:multiple sugar transport system permease protein
VVASRLSLPKISLSRSTVNWLYVLLFLSPSLVGVLAFTLIPTLSSLGISFTEWSIIGNPVYVGLKNYIRLVSEDPVFGLSLKLTFYYAALSIPLSMGGALLLALAVNQRLRGMVVFRIIYFVPVVTSMVAWAMIWRWLYAMDYGLINTALQSLGLPQVGWLTDRNWVIPALVVMSVWKGLGYGMIIYLAGLQGIPYHLYEAAKIDGANSWQLFWRITMPLLSPTHFFMLVTSVIGSFQVFDSVYLMTRGGPGNASRVYNFYLFQQAFSYRHMGYASAMAWILFIIIFVITMIQVRFLQRGVTYDLA